MRSATAKTGAAGEYRFDLLPVGHYSIHVEAPGFAAGEIKDIDLLVGTTAAANVPLKPGSTAETVQVQANNQLVDPEKSDVSTAVTPQADYGSAAEWTRLCQPCDPGSGREAWWTAMIRPRIAMRSTR